MRVKVEWWVVGGEWSEVRVSAPGAALVGAISPPPFSHAGLSQNHGRESLYTQMVWFG